MTAAAGAVRALLEMHKVGVLLSQIPAEKLSGWRLNVLCAARDRFQQTKTLSRVQCDLVRQLHAEAGR